MKQKAMYMFAGALLYHVWCTGGGLLGAGRRR